MTLAEEFRSRNFSIYGQWSGVVDIVLCFAIGISAIFKLSIWILFGVLCIVSGFLIIFIEIPLLLRICPTSEKFDTFIRRFTTNYMRALIYALMSLIQWLSLIKDTSVLIVPAIALIITAAFYLAAGVKGQGFVGSKTLGGAGVAQMIL
ncbi:MAG: Golgi apparatus membrane protein tvp18 [Chrysothrix sp. TS-e1954]|nr:MAG: Golgi apparatus membrane protein tvp18 [Chrysothrix sp. TS-e1954]